MDFIKTESTIPAMLSSDNFSKFPHDEALNENLPTLIKVKQETFDPDDKFYNLINHSTLANHQIENTMNIKTEATNVLSLLHNNIGLSTETLSSTMSDAKDSLGLNLNQLSTSIIKYESIDIKVENHDELDAITPDLESSLISIKDESYGKLENFTQNECLAQFSNNFCNICGKNFINIQNLNRHCKEVHEKNTKYSCKICNKIFVRKEHLKNHEKIIHLKIRDWKCNLCDKYFTQKFSLLVHEKSVHLKIQDWKCNYCDKCFAAKSSLKYHENSVHLKIRNWKCNICEKSFVRKGDLKAHGVVHLKDFSEISDICSNKPVRHLRAYKNYMHPETCAQNFKCTHCDKVFFRKYYLKQHIMAHSDVRDWKCKICNKSFKSKNNLQRHERIHSNKSSNTSLNSSKSYFNS